MLQVMSYISKCPTRVSCVLRVPVALLAFALGAAAQNANAEALSCFGVYNHPVRSPIEVKFFKLASPDADAPTWKIFNAAVIAKRAGGPDASLFEGEVRVTSNRVGTIYNANLRNDLTGATATFFLGSPQFVAPQVNCGRGECAEPVTKFVRKGFITIGESTDALTCYL